MSKNKTETFSLQALQPFRFFYSLNSLNSLTSLVSLTKVFLIRPQCVPKAFVPMRPQYILNVFPNASPVHSNASLMRPQIIPRHPQWVPNACPIRHQFVPKASPKHPCCLPNAYPILLFTTSAKSFRSNSSLTQKSNNNRKETVKNYSCQVRFY